jgi:hypothetical protein
LINNVTEKSAQWSSKRGHKGESLKSERLGFDFQQGQGLFGASSDRLHAQATTNTGGLVPEGKYAAKAKLSHSPLPNSETQHLERYLYAFMSHFDIGANFNYMVLLQYRSYETEQ